MIRRLLCFLGFHKRFAAHRGHTDLTGMSDVVRCPHCLDFDYLTR